MMSIANFNPVGIAVWVSWNIFLAVIPVAIAYIMDVLSSKKPIKPFWLSFIIWLPALLAWLAFQPNTCYLFTEWRHFLRSIDSNDLYLKSYHDDDALTTMLVQAVFFLLFSSAGLITFVLSIRPMERFLRKHGVPIYGWAPIFFPMCSLGVYLGLILRYNSWELVTQPSLILNSSLNALTNSFLLITILSFAGFLWIIYEFFDLAVDGISERIKKIHFLRKNYNRRAI